MSQAATQDVQTCRVDTVFNIVDSYYLYEMITSLILDTSLAFLFSLTSTSLLLQYKFFGSQIESFYQCLECVLSRPGEHN